MLKSRLAWLTLLLFAPALSVAAQEAPAVELAPPETALEAAVVPVIPFAAANAANVRVPSAADAWGGPRSAAHATLSDRVTSYVIEAELDPATHVIKGRQVMRWRNRSEQPVGTIYLHMYLNAFEGPGSTLMNERRTLSGSGRARGNEVLKDGQWGHITLDSARQDGAEATQSWVQPDGGPETDHTVLALDLPQAVPAGETLELEMAFTSQLPRVVIRTGWWGDFHLVGQWFPKIGVLELPGERGATAPRWNVHEFHFHSEFYADYGSYDVRLTVPEGYTVGATGEETGEPVRADGKVTHRFVQHDVVDFAWMAAPDFKTIDTTWTGPGSPEVKVRVIYPEEYAAVAEPVQRATLDSLSYFSETLGPYPYRTVTAVVPPYNAQEAGGMEYPTFFTASGSKTYQPGTLTEAMIDFVTIHEFGHGYFMGLLGSNEFEEPMLDEGLNEYWDQRMLSDRGQRLHLATSLTRRLGLDLSIEPWMYERISGVVGIGFPADSLDANAWDRASSMSYGSVYSRSAITFRTLENLVGSEAMGRAMKLYYERWKFRHPSAADFREALREGTGQPDLVDAVFESQVYGIERLDYLVESISAREQLPRSGTFLEDGARVERSEAAVKEEIEAARKAWKEAHPEDHDGGPWPWHSVVTVRRLGTPFPVTVRVHFADGSSEDVAWTDERPWQRLEFTGASKVVAAEIDPERKILLDVNLLNNARRVEIDRTVPNRLGAIWSSLVASLHAFMVTL